MGNSLQAWLQFAFRNALQQQQQEEEDDEESGIQTQEPEEEDDEGDFTCGICFEELSRDKEFKRVQACVNGAADAAAHRFCTDCIGKYIEVQVDDRVAHVECPALNCSDRLDPLLCKHTVSATTLDKWCDNLRDSYLLGTERCHCPYRDCMELVLNECGGDVRISKCPKCNKLFCFKCKIPWHGGYECDQSDQMRNVNDVLLEQLMARNRWIKCPKCGHGVERRSGCPNMKCRCKTRFCYNCGRERCICGDDQVRNAGVFEEILSAYLFIFVFLVFAVLILVSFSIHNHHNETH